MRDLHSRNRPPRFPIMVDELSSGSLSRQRSPKWRENDQRTAERIASKHSQILLTGNHEWRWIFETLKLSPETIGSNIRRGLLRNVEADSGLQEADICPVLLSRDYSGAQTIRPHRLEQSVRVQRNRPTYQRIAAKDLPRSIRRRAVHCFEILNRYRTLQQLFPLKFTPASCSTRYQSAQL